jgi:uncharacterized protein YdaU (DUF1376 family)
MAKDPAFLFYYQDFLVGTDSFTNEEIGAYIKCLCHQAHKGYISSHHMSKICQRQEVQKTVKEKFISDGNGNLYNERLNSEIEKRRKYSESRKKNRMGKKTHD